MLITEDNIAAYVKGSYYIGPLMDDSGKVDNNMKQIEAYFEEEYQVTVESVESKRKEADLLFALLTDSHLSDNGDHTRANIAAVDQAVKFNFMVHLGDFLTGSTPEKITRKNLREEIEGYRSSLNNRILYVAQGNHDGYRDESYQGQLVDDISMDEKWYEDTCFIDSFDNVQRPGNKPYYYVDYPEKEIRLIFLCTTSYDIDTDKKIFNKKYELDEAQLKWFGEEALRTAAGYTLMVFSHIQPFAEIPFTEQEDNVKWSANYGEIVKLLQAYQNGNCIEADGNVYDFCGCSGNVIGWFFGHNHGDFHKMIGGINYVETTSQVAYVPQLWKAIGEFPGPRDLNTVNEDAWDAAVWCKVERKLYLYRFGAGKDRVISY